VLKEIEALKEKLGQRKQLREVDKDVERAKEDVVSCLRLNDRRPLDCWQEVKIFKDQVAKMEGKFVERVMN
jgi:MICOS complex subunit MIC19